MLSKPSVTTHDIAKLLKVTEATVRCLDFPGAKLRANRLGREFRMANTYLDTFVNTHATKPGLRRQGETD